MYDPWFRHLEEVELRRRLGDRYRIQHLGMPLYRYRMHESNKTKMTEYKVYKETLDRAYSKAGF